MLIEAFLSIRITEMLSGCLRYKTRPKGPALPHSHHSKLASKFPPRAMSSAIEKEAEASPSPSLSSQPSSPTCNLQRFFLLLINSTLLLLGTGGPLLLRVYFVNGGTHFWLSSLVQICGWPLLFIPLTHSYLRRRRALGPRDTHLLLLTPPLAGASAALGLLQGIDCYLYAYGSSYLPLSTSSLLVSTQLAFTAGFALLIVRHRFTAFTVNSVVLLTLGPVVLALGSGGERPSGESGGRYLLGFVMTIGAAALIGLSLPLTELVYRRTKQKITYALVMEMQLVMGIFGTAFCLVGIAASKEFQAIHMEARKFELGKLKYYMVLIWDAIFWQAFNLGLVGLISGTSSLLAGILIAVLLPVTEVFAIIFFKEKFNGSKGVSLALCLWGFFSYLYGEMKQNKKLKKAVELELHQPIP